MCPWPNCFRILREIRTDQGLTQENLVFKFGLPMQTISLLESVLVKSWWTLSIRIIQISWAINRDRSKRARDAQDIKFILSNCEQLPGIVEA